MKHLFPRLIIAGLKGGSGKTILSLGLITAWKKKGITVVPYKKGPDYIDAGWLSSAARQPCYNLDPFMIGREKILSSFREHFNNAGCAVIEGNRGLYDGMDSKGTYSTAELSKTLRSPVILVIDCTKVTRTAGAIILGMQKFDRNVDIRGVVLNRIAGARHEKVVRESIEEYCKIPVLGSIPKLKQDFLSERHMGLTPFQEHPAVKKAISYTAEIAQKYLDLDKIWKIACQAKPLSAKKNRSPKSKFQNLPAGRQGPKSKIKIGIIRDSAFQFYYPENFEELEKRGADLLEISALKEKKLPKIDALYIGGGFPETHAITLAKNTSFKRSILKAVEEGLPVYAECGGLMYLGKALVLDKKTYLMAGVFPIKFCLEKRPQAHGYTIVKVNRSNPFYVKGTILKGHEFHYSRVMRIYNKKGLTLCFIMKRGNGISDKMDGLCYKNALATYTHLHALGSPEWADGLMKKALTYQQKRKATFVTQKRVTKILKENNLVELIELSEREHGIFRILISLAYDKEDLLCWRAIEAVGLIAGEVAQKEPETVRTLVGRLLWTIREESGGIGWSAPEMLGEIVRNSPDKFSDIAPIVASFHDEEMLRQGVLRALVRIGEVRPDLIRSSLTFISHYLHDRNAAVRFYAVMLVRIFELREYIPNVKMLKDDNSAVSIYIDGDFQDSSVGKIAEQTVIMLLESEN